MLQCTKMGRVIAAAVCRRILRLNSTSSFGSWPENRGQDQTSSSSATTSPTDGSSSLSTRRRSSTKELIISKQKPLPDPVKRFVVELTVADMPRKTHYIREKIFAINYELYIVIATSVLTILLIILYALWNKWAFRMESTLGWALVREEKGERRDADKLMKSALKISQKKPLDAAIIYLKMVDQEIERKNYEKAMAHLKEAQNQATRATNNHQDSKLHLRIYMKLAHLYSLIDMPDNAKSTFDLCITLLKKWTKEDRSLKEAIETRLLLLHVYRVYGAFCQKRSMNKEAVQLYQEALFVFQDVSGVASSNVKRRTPDIVAILIELAKLSLAEKKPSEAYAYAQQALEQYSNTKEESETYLLLGNICLVQNKNKEAETNFQTALEAARKIEDGEMVIMLAEKGLAEVHKTRWSWWS